MKCLVTMFLSVIQVKLIYAIKLQRAFNVGFFSQGELSDCEEESETSDKESDKLTEENEVNRGSPKDSEVKWIKETLSLFFRGCG